MVRLLLAERNGPAEAAIRDVAKSLPGVDLAWEVHEMPEVLRLVQQEHPNVVLLSHSLLKSELVTSIRAIAKKSPNVKILLLSTHSDSRFALRAIEAGVSGYIVQDRAFEELGNAVETVVSGRVYLSPGIAGLERVVREGRVSINGAAIESARDSSDAPKYRWQPRVLVVDDEEALLEMYSTVFEQAGYSVVEAATCDEAIAAVHSELPDIAFVDLLMPGRSGVPVIQAIRALDETLPVVVVTAYPDSELMFQAMAYSPFLVLAKPVRLESLLKTARSALAGRSESSSRAEGVVK